MILFNSNNLSFYFIKKCQKIHLDWLKPIFNSFYSFYYLFLSIEHEFCLLILNKFGNCNHLSVLMIYLFNIINKSNYPYMMPIMMYIR